MTTHYVGQVTEVLPAFSCETHARTTLDEIALCECTVLELCGSDTLVAIKGTGDVVYVPTRRLKPARVAG